MKIQSSALSLALSATVATSLLLTGCSEGESEVTTINPDPNPSEPFFNSNAKYSFADSMVGKFSGFFRTATMASSGVSAKRAIAAVENTSIPCQDGGAMGMSITMDDSTGELTGMSIDFNSCRQGNETSNGSIGIVSNLDASGENGTVIVSANDFSVTGGVEPVAVNGKVSLSMQTNGDQSTTTISGPSLSMTAGNETVMFSNYSIVAQENSSTDDASLSGGMTIASSVDGTVSIDINPALRTDGFSEYPVAGRLIMTHSDGSSLAMNADNGNPNTFDYTITENGTVSSGVANWADTELGDL